MENKYLIAKSCSQAIELSKINPDFSYISGGTDLMINKYQKNNTSKTLIDLSEIEEMKSFKINESEVRIGSAITLSEIENNKKTDKPGIRLKVYVREHMVGGVQGFCFCSYR